MIKRFSVGYSDIREKNTRTADMSAQTVLSSLITRISHNTAYLLLWSSDEGEGVAHRRSTHGKHLKWTKHFRRVVLMENDHWRVKTFYYSLSEFVRERRLDSSGCLLYTWWYIFQEFSCTSGFLRNVVRFPLRTVLYFKKTSQALGSTQSPTE
jgi:hypothetical protein